MKLTLAYTPCPNDTFMVHGLTSGHVRIPGCTIETRRHDVETLNEHAFRGTFDISKLSFHAWLLVRDRYRLLRSGAALGFGCGPLLVSRRHLTRSDLARCRIAVPGRYTTAHLLLRLYAPDARNRAFVPYDRICPAVLTGEADCGVIIHESRFTFEAMGLQRVVDLGEWWETETGLPIPLGCMAARADLPDAVIAGAEQALRESVEQAFAAPEAPLRDAAHYAQEMDPEVLRRHVETYVNDFSLDLGPTGEAALDELTRRARTAGITA